MSLGATLCPPGTAADYACRIAGLVGQGVTSAVLCLEDAIRDVHVAAAERNVAAQLNELDKINAPAPLLFVRVRQPEQIRSLIKEIGSAATILTHLPRFSVWFCRGLD